MAGTLKRARVKAMMNSCDLNDFAYLHGFCDRIRSIYGINVITPMTYRKFLSLLFQEHNWKRHLSPKKVLLMGSHGRTDGRLDKRNGDVITKTKVLPRIGYGIFS